MGKILQLARGDHLIDVLYVDELVRAYGHVMSAFDEDLRGALKRLLIEQHKAILIVFERI